MADTGGKRYGDGCAGGERGGATTARAVCTQVLSVVHGIAASNPRAGDRTPSAEALAIGYWIIVGQYLLLKSISFVWVASDVSLLHPKQKFIHKLS